MFKLTPLAFVPIFVNLKLKAKFTNQQTEIKVKLYLALHKFTISITMKYVLLALSIMNH